MATCAVSSIPSNFGNFPVTDTVTSTLLLLLSGVTDIESIITNVSMIPTTSHWYFNMTPFETMFMGLIVAQIVVLHWLQILPFNINQFLNGSASGRKKRHIVIESSRQKMANTMLQALRHFDKNECVPRALCDIQYSATYNDYSLPRDTKLTLAAIKASSDERRKLNKKESSKKDVKNNDKIKEDKDELLWLEQAVDLGSSPEQLISNGTLCATKYKICPVTTKEILSYLDVIQAHYFY